jgi:hypothetical protein
MKLLISFLILLPLAAQTPAPAPPAAPAPAADAKPADAKPADAKPADAKPADAAPPTEAKTETKSDAPAASPVPTGEDWLTGFIDVGYRWRPGVAGSMNTYRSIVDLFPGPMLLGAEFVIRDKKKRLFDRIEVRAYDWGHDPYSTLHVNVFKENAYQLVTDYRNMALFDNEPSFADPYITNGVMIDEQSFDMRRRISNVLLEIKPGTWLIPYLAWDHDSGQGSGVTTFVSGVNQYPFLSGMTDSTDSYRGGVRLELRRFHVTLEEGGTTFKSAQNTFVPPGNTYYGSQPILPGATTLDLTSLAQAYGIRGSSIYSKALTSAHVTDWLDVTGQFLYSIPHTDVNYTQYNYGSFASLNQALYYNSEQNLIGATAKMPHTTGSAGTEIRPYKHVRIVDSWMTDRLHNAASALQDDILGKSPAINTDLTSLLVTNYSQAEGMVFVDILKGLVARAGYRHVWGDADEMVLPPEGLITHDNLKLRRNVLLLGVSYRPTAKASISADAEVGSSGNAYFPVSLYDYQKVRVHGNYQLPWALNLSANVSVLQNTSPLPNKNDFLSHTESLTMQWNPKVVKVFSFIGTWEHNSLSSDIYYLPPQTLSPAVSNYWESGHTITGLVATTIPVFGVNVQFAGGGSFLLSNGSRATNYYQPVGKLSVPIGKHLAWNSEWRYYGFNEAFYLYESFRTHLITTGLRFTR